MSMNIDTFMQDHYEDMVKWTKSYLPEPYDSEAEDIVADTYMYLKDKNVELIEDTASTFVIGAIKDRCANLMRDAGRRAEAVHKLAESLDEPESAADPMDILMAEEEVQGRIERLSAIERETLQKHYVEGMSRQELADEEGCTLAVIDMRLMRGRNKLKGE
jgi:RNA polymerase sigma factor (sigma-70 family)